MGHTIIHAENIRRFLDGDMEGKAQKQFAETLEEHPADKWSVHYIQAMRYEKQEAATFEDFEDMEAFFEDEEQVAAQQEELQTWLKNTPKKTAKRIQMPSQWRYMRWAALLVALLVPVALLYFQQGERLEMVAYTPAEIQRSFTPTSSEDLALAYEQVTAAYERGEYKALIALVDSFATIYPYDIKYIPYMQLTKGMAHFALKQYDAAIAAYALAKDDSRTDISEHNWECDYYTAMAYWEMKQIATTRDILQDISQRASPDFLHRFKVREWLSRIK